MKAIVLAAGRGERMRPLTDRCPKPLLEVRGKPLIAWHLEALARAGVREVVVNTAWLEAQIVARLGDGAEFGLRIVYSMEGRDHGGALETAGGLKKALPLLRDSRAPGGGNCFWYVAADVHAPGFGFDPAAADAFAATDELARLWMVPNPPQHPRGDFTVDNGLLRAAPAAGDAVHSQAGDADAAAGDPRTRTWSGIGLFRPAFVDELLADLTPGTKAPLRPSLDRAATAGRLGAVAYDGPWTDVGTPQRLAELQGA